jgi:hypothetical protein
VRFACASLALTASLIHSAVCFCFLPRVHPCFAYGSSGLKASGTRLMQGQRPASASALPPWFRFSGSSLGCSSPLLLADRFALDRSPSTFRLRLCRSFRMLALWAGCVFVSTARASASSPLLLAAFVFPSSTCSSSLPLCGSSPASWPSPSMTTARRRFGGFWPPALSGRFRPLLTFDFLLYKCPGDRRSAH